ncbi:MAG: PEP/pyruvate-binding domain-containing protein [bacterium]|jgi:CheY-like chemotaxis protein|nr:PEP/pyruvate-binding domain-containing protein [bacterium]
MTRNRFDHIAGFQELIQHRVSEILLVASLYDAFLLAQDGQLQDLIASEFASLNLVHAPKITRVSRAGKALETLKAGQPCDMILLTVNVGDMHVLQLVRELRGAGITIPVILLAYDARHLAPLLGGPEADLIDHVFVWQGDFRILIAIVKLVEDRLNVEQDSRVMGVQSVILVEDNVRFYSSYLPAIYKEIVQQAHRLMDEGLNLAHKVIRMRARPKILLARTYEEAWRDFEAHRENLLGIITDLEFPRAGEVDPDAGLHLIRAVRARSPELPILLQSNQPHVLELGEQLGVGAVRKNSRNLLRDVRGFMRDNFGFGDFVFRLPDGTPIGRARDLHALERALETVPEESLRFHAERGHFSKWLKARTEFGLSRLLEPRRVNEFPSLEAMRHYLIEALGDYRLDRTRGIVSEFHPETFDPRNSLAQIGKGSMGGKARGLSFVRHLLSLGDLGERWPGIRVAIPPAVVLCTEVFDQFVELGDLQDFALDCDVDEQIRQRFLAAIFPPLFQIDLRHVVELLDGPLAVRSSSLLEDSQYQPFAGIYRTIMLPNSSADHEQRLRELIDAIKLVYASTYCQAAKSYMRSTPYRMEEEKMAVIIQRLQGARHGDHFYPAISGTARSTNFYPTAPAMDRDGVASVALGLGHLVSEGAETVRFCPRYPRHLGMFMHAGEALQYGQKQFYALRLTGDSHVGATEGTELETLELDQAERDGTLAWVGSVYSPENDAVYDGLSRPGARFVSFAPVLKHDLFPLAEIISRLLRVGSRGMSRPVELEFAVNLFPTGGETMEFSVLQMRPMVLSQELDELNLEVDPARVICRSSSVLGAGRLDDIHDLLVVDVERFERRHSREVAAAVGDFNRTLVQEQRPFLLVGVGRWGSSDPWLGIPVSWDQISGVRVIVEAGFRDLIVTPSQGSHFFQNLTALGIGYFTVNPQQGEGELDWDWLLGQPTFQERGHVRHLRLEQPLCVLMNARSRSGVILRPAPA